MTYSIAQIRKLSTFALVLAAIFATGCSQSRSAARRAEIEKPKPPPPPEAWIQAKSFAVLPLTKPELPPTAGQLAASITDAWRGAIQLKDPAGLVTILGGRYPAIDTLRVDLTGASVVPAKKPASKAVEPQPTGQAVAVEHFALFADPMTSRKSQIKLQITGEHVRLEVQKDKEGKSSLMMADARSGTLHFDVSMADLEKLVLATVKESASKHAITVRAVRLSFVSVSPRSLNVEMHVSTLIGFIPAGLRFTARVDVDDQMNARIWSLDVDGDEVLGPLISHFLRPRLAKHNGKTKRLIGFANEAVKLKDVRIHAGERFTLTSCE